MGLLERLRSQGGDPYPATPPRLKGDPEGFGPRHHDRSGGSTVEEAQLMANIGKSISIHGDLTGNEDLVIEGSVEGKINLPTGQLTIGSGGSVVADLHAKSIVVIGHVKGDVHATERAEIQGSGVVEGNVHAPRLSIEDGAVLRGSVLMEPKREAGTAATRSTTKGAATGSERPSLGAAQPPLA